jgi:hypothetical protein
LSKTLCASALPIVKQAWLTGVGSPGLGPVVAQPAVRRIASAEAQLVESLGIFALVQDVDGRPHLFRQRLDFGNG